ncbi:MAG: type II secretion system F family protein [Patescibacteria group bacterium]
MNFIYQAKNSPSQIIEGAIEADSILHAQAVLARKGLFPIFIKEEIKNKINFHFLNRISQRDINIFTQQLSNLINAGMPLLKALEIIYNQTSNRRFKAILFDIKDKVKTGFTLSSAISDHKDIFRNHYIALIRAGESSGALDKVCFSLSEFSESEEDLRSKIQVALSYPLFIFIVGAATLYILFTFIIPKMSFIFLSLTDSLPLPTRVLLALSNFLKTKGLLIVLALGLFFYLTKRYLKTVDGKFKFDKAVLRLPLLGNFIKKNQIAIFIKTLSLLTKYKIPIPDALNIASYTITNRLLFEKVNELRLDILKGMSFRDSLKENDYLEFFAVDLISTAQESGSFEFALNKISDIYNRDIERNIKIFTSVLEPMMILIMGIIVGLIVSAMLLPIFQMNLLIK